MTSPLSHKLLPKKFTVTYSAKERFQLRMSPLLRQGWKQLRGGRRTHLQNRLGWRSLAMARYRHNRLQALSRSQDAHIKETDRERGTARCPIGDTSACRRQEDQGIVDEQIIGEGKPVPGNRRWMADRGHEPVLNPPNRLAALVLLEDDFVCSPFRSIRQRPAECRVEAERYRKRLFTFIGHHDSIDEDRARNFVCTSS